MLFYLSLCTEVRSPFQSLLINDQKKRFCAAGHIKDPVPLFEKSRASCPSGRFPPSFIHQVIIITGLNKLYDCMFSP